ncbi:MAG: hypothetical protein IPK83_10535 [Planctomycetes bacterium]|nr:hypothetical protein [Planctomycetota bacterium]
MFSIEIGREYVVYGITHYLGHLWYYICDEDYTYFPIWNPSPLFRIIDDRLSIYWRIGISTIGNDNRMMPIISFSEWVNSNAYYDQLTDGDKDAIAVFERYKQLMDQEAENSRVSG